MPPTTQTGPQMKESAVPMIHRSASPLRTSFRFV
nr:MAG TPA: hypothetical protein [Caudoviricetes sp.]